MRLLLPLLILWFCLGQLSHGADTGAIKAGAEASAKALQRGEYSGVLDRTYPKVIEMGGGRETMLKQVREAMDAMKKDGFTIQSVTVGKPGAPITGTEQVFSIVPMVLKLETPTVIVTSNGYLLAVSDDRGSTWSYIDGSVLTPELLKQLFPNVPKALKLPEKKEPTVEKKKK